METKLIQFAKELQSLKKEGNKLEEKVKKLKELEDQLQIKFVAAMEDQKIDNFKVKGIGTCYLQESIYPREVKEEVLFAELRKRKVGFMIKETVNFQTLRGYLGECIKNGTPFPKGVDVFIQPKVRIRKGE